MGISRAVAPPCRGAVRRRKIAVDTDDDDDSAAGHRDMTSSLRHLQTRTEAHPTLT